jgi:transposase
MTSRGAEKMNNDTIGVDVSKDHLDAHRLADGASRRFANDKGGHKALIKWLAETPANRVVFEPTGPYHRAIERALGAAGVPFVKVNPRQARRFAEATGKLAKTDRLDAAILARMGALLELEARPARSEVLLELKQLYVAREALVKDRTAAKNRGKVLTLSLLKRQNAQRLEQIHRQIATVEAAILQIVEADASLADRFAILISIPGLSDITAFALLRSQCRSSAPSKPARPPTSQAWRRSPDRQDVGPVAHSFAAGAPTSARRSPCRPSSPLASIQT